MCRGCSIKFKGEDSCCDEYLDWFWDYESAISEMKKIEVKLSVFVSGMDNQEQKEKMNNFRRRLIKQRKDYSKATELLTGISN